LAEAQALVQSCGVGVVDVDIEQHVIIARCSEVLQCLNHERRSDTALAPLWQNSNLNNPPLGADNKPHWDVIVIGQQRRYMEPLLMA